MKVTFGKVYVKKVFPKSKYCYVYIDGIRCWELVADPNILPIGSDSWSGEYADWWLEYIIGKTGNQDTKRMLTHMYPDRFYKTYCKIMWSENTFASQEERLSTQ